MSLRVSTQELTQELPHFGDSWSNPGGPVHTLPNTGNHPACHKTAGRLGSHFFVPGAASWEPLLGAVFESRFWKPFWEPPPVGGT